MPSARKRIGYLPSPIAQKLITLIAGNENLSQSKVVGTLVEEALLARGLYIPQKINPLNNKQLYKNQDKIDNITLKYNDIDELISDKGITYNKKEYTSDSHFLKEVSEDSIKEKNEALFKQFKQFLLFQEMLKEK